MNIKPLGNRVLVKQLEEEKVTQSGIVLPDTMDSKKKIEAEVIAIGDGEKVTKLGLQAGDKVIIEKWGGEEVELTEDGKKVEYKILDHDKVLAKVTSA
jgi:chaperonin GroES